MTAYLIAQAGLWTTSTVQRRLASIAQAHKAAQVDSPTQHATVRLVWAGIRREKGMAQRGKAALSTAQLRALVGALGEGVLAVRDRALLLLGFAGALRRSELVGLDVADVTWTEEGLVMTLRWSKTDQEGQGRKIGIPTGVSPLTCPVQALHRWLTTAGVSEGPLFRAVNRHGQVQARRLTDQVVALVVKRTAAAIGLDPRDFAGHSLRAGLATQAAANGASERAIMKQTGHRSVQTVRRYIREGSLFRENAAAMVGL